MDCCEDRRSNVKWCPLSNKIYVSYKFSLPIYVVNHEAFTQKSDKRLWYRGKLASLQVHRLLLFPSCGHRNNLGKHPTTTYLYRRRCVITYCHAVTFQVSKWLFLNEKLINFDMFFNWQVVADLRRKERSRLEPATVGTGHRVAVSCQLTRSHAEEQADAIRYSIFNVSDHCSRVAPVTPEIKTSSLVSGGIC